MKRDKLIYWISTGLLTVLMLFSAFMYFFKNADIQQAFTSFGYPTFLIYPLAIAKLLGLVAIWTRRSKTLTEWAYAGFFFDTLLATQAHIMAQDGQFMPALFGVILVLASYWSSKKVFV